MQKDFLIQSNLNKFDRRSVSKYYEIAHTGRSENIQNTINEQLLKETT